MNKPKSPNLKVYIYARWPRQADPPVDYDVLWLRSYTQGSKGTEESRDYFEKLVTELRNRRSEAVLLVPVGHAFYEMNQRMKAGQVPGFNNIFQFYADEIHTTDNGSYLAACTYFATYYKENPAGLNTKGWSNVNQDIVSIIQSVAWKVVTENSYWTGY